MGPVNRPPRPPEGAPLRRTEPPDDEHESPAARPSRELPKAVKEIQRQNREPWKPRSAPIHEDTKVGIPAPPASDPYTPKPPPPRSLSPSPESAAFRVKYEDVDFRVGKGSAGRLRTFLWPILGTAAVSVVLGYYGGLKAAGARMRAEEARTAELAGELAELRATHDSKLKNQGAMVAREGVLTSDHDARLRTLETRVEIMEQRVTDLSKQKAIIVKPQ